MFPQPGLGVRPEVAASALEHAAPEARHPANARPQLVPPLIVCGIELPGQLEVVAHHLLPRLVLLVLVLYLLVFNVIVFVVVQQHLDGIRALQKNPGHGLDQCLGNLVLLIVVLVS